MRSQGVLCIHAEYLVGVVVDDEGEPGRGDGWANADGVLVAAVLVLLRVTEVAIGIVLQVVVGVVRAPDMHGDLPGPVVRRVR